MTDNSSNLQTPGKVEIGISCGLLTVVLLAAYPLFAWFGYSQHGADGLLAAAVAGIVCWFGGIAALVLTTSVRSPEGAVSGTLLGMLFRMGFPLAAGVMLDRSGGALAAAGVLGMILLYYLLTLVVETLLSLRLVNPGRGVSKAS